MSRYRPPSKPKTNILTAEGATILRKELRKLWIEERPEVTAAVSAAAKNGDRSENGDYIYGKKRLREIDSRVRYLTKRLDNANIVEQAPNDQSKIFFGAWVTVEDDDEQSFEYRIVGPDEIGHAEAYISIDSPLARALLGKTVDDDVEITTPSGQKAYYIVHIHY